MFSRRCINMSAFIPQRDEDEVTATFLDSVVGGPRGVENGVGVATL